MLCFTIFPASRSWHVLEPQSSFSLSTISPALERSTRTRWTRGAWSPSGKRHRLPVSPNHSSEYSSTSSAAQSKSSGLPPTSHPSISLFTLHFLCVLCKIVATDVNMHVLGVCKLPNGSRNRFCIRHVHAFVIFS